MKQLMAKKPVFEQTRFKCLLYGDKGSGKTHFCCSLPSPYYISSENIKGYKHFMDMLVKNNGDYVFLTELQEIIDQVICLLSQKHDYKTLVIDSISVPVGWLSNMEVERLTKKSPNTEGTEFGANVSKGKRMLFKLGILLDRLDMNVIVTSHQRIKYRDGKEIGDSYDIDDKLAYLLGSTFKITSLPGDKRLLYVEKSRYEQLKQFSNIDFKGYETLTSLFGEDIFVKESIQEVLATKEQCLELKRLINLLQIAEETVQKWCISAKSNNIQEMSSTSIQKCIDHLNKKMASNLEDAA